MTISLYFDYQSFTLDRVECLREGAKKMKKCLIYFSYAGLLALLLSSCPNGLMVEALSVAAAPKAISDGANEDGNEHFYFLPLFHQPRLF